MEAWDFPIVFGSQIQTVPIRTCACVYCAEARDMPHHQAYWLSAKKTPSIEKVFHITSQNLVLAHWSVQEDIAFLAFDMCG